jgi:hypothetical protein
MGYITTLVCVFTGCQAVNNLPHCYLAGSLKNKGLRFSFSKRDGRFCGSGEETPS